jgi:hypothetical protein
VSSASILVGYGIAARYTWVCKWQQIDSAMTVPDPSRKDWSVSQQRKRSGMNY